MSDEDMETRKAVRMLLRLSNQFQARAKSFETTINTIIQLPPDGRASLKGDDVRDLIQEARAMADEIVLKSTAQLEQTLDAGNHWRPAVLAYVSSLLKDE